MTLATSALLALTVLIKMAFISTKLWRSTDSGVHIRLLKFSVSSFFLPHHRVLFLQANYIYTNACSSPLYSLLAATSPPFTILAGDCRQGYRGTDKDILAQQRCCPAGKCSNNTNLMKNGVTFNHTDDQCLDGYSGALCLVCAKNYVLQGEHCEKCEGGSDFIAAFTVLLSLAFVVFLSVLCLLVCAPSKKKLFRKIFWTSKNYFNVLTNFSLHARSL